MRKRKQLIKHLSGFITKERIELLNHNLKQRTNHLAIVLEDIFHSQNASAVLRTADCFGVQNIHIIAQMVSTSKLAKIKAPSQKSRLTIILIFSKKHIQRVQQKISKILFDIIEMEVTLSIILSPLLQILSL